MQHCRWLSSLGTQGAWAKLRSSLGEPGGVNAAAASIPEVWGKVHSVESFSAVDGPGVRFLVFLQGCGLRCSFCSNPDTWEFSGGELMSSKQLAKRVDRMLPYLQAQRSQSSGHESGVTFSGGEAMLQPQFVAAMCQEAHARGLTTCIDTTGQGTKEHNWDVVLPHLDYALFCIKSPIKAKYEALTNRKGLHRALNFARELEDRGIKYWLRYVMIPGITDTPEDIEALVNFSAGKRSMQAVELLPYHTLGLDKWKELGLVYPLEGQRSPTAEEVVTFRAAMHAAGIPVLGGTGSGAGQALAPAPPSMPLASE